jgi:hypothetical protein
VCLKQGKDTRYNNKNLKMKKKLSKKKRSNRGGRTAGSL